MPNKLNDIYSKSHKDENGCLIYRGGQKYPLIRIDGIGQTSIARYIMHLNNPSFDIRDWKQQVLHVCDNPGCINIDHLKIGTQQDNIKDMYSKGRGPERLRKSHCINGHEYTPENSRIDSRGNRLCRICVKTTRNKNRILRRKTNQ